MSKDLVSIIMLSKNKAQYVEESVRSVLAQTYQNWELIFMDDSSSDDTIHQMMTIREQGQWKRENGKVINRMKISRTVSERGDISNSNSAIKEARGRWISFLNVGDIWAPDKLEKQISFMEEHGYVFSYHPYRLMDSVSRDRGFLISGKEHVNHQDMLKCCWPAYLTVMYDAEKLGILKNRSEWTNYYALWLNITDHHDCYLLPENLATLRTRWNKLGKIILTNNLKWRYDAFRLEEDLGRFKSLCYTIRNMWYGVVKWWKYVKRAS